MAIFYILCGWTEGSPINGRFRLSMLLILCSLFVLSHCGERKNGRSGMGSEDPNSRFACEGPLADYAACQCNENEGDVSCINAQITDTSVLSSLASYYKGLNRITLHGNNFQVLPSGSIFGSSSPYSSLQSLNLSANYIVNLHSNTLEGLRSLETLDLSYNEIVLHENQTDFLQPVPQLKELFLRNVFTKTSNRTTQLSLLMKTFEKAKLHQLEVLDLSHIFTEHIPFNLPCLFPRLKRLDLKQNLIRTLFLNSSCLSNIHTIDLRGTPIRTIDSSFRHLMGSLRDDTVNFNMGYFYCDCKSVEWIRWLMSTKKVRNKGELTCYLASPTVYAKQKVLQIPLEKLDCSVDIWKENSASSLFFSFNLAILTSIKLFLL